jgi:hypothetical protein
MLNEDSFHYAIENTRVLFEPQQRIQTFGNTNFQFYLVTELMDSVNEVRVRSGRIHAERPQIISLGNLSQLMLEGFGEKAREFADWIARHPEQLAFLKYGIQFRKTDVIEDTLQCSVDEAVERIQKNEKFAGEPLNAIIQGVDDAWEVCLLKFTVDLIRKSAPGNMGDFRNRGLL